MTYFRILLLSIIVVFFSGCPDKSVQEIIQKPAYSKNKLLLISMDGFRWDYIDKVETPNLDKFIQNGVKAASLIPSFPSKTFPNHYSIVSGSYPAHHGLISNHMYDETMDAYYKIGAGSSSVKDGRWYQREPIWVTAEKNDIETGIFFWPGSEAKINGFLPTNYKAYNPLIAWDKRVDQVVEWLKDPSIGFTALYYNEPDHQGHNFGPNSPKVFEKIKVLDKTLGRLFDIMEKENLSQKTNIIIVSDHGMTSIDYKNAIFLDDYIDLSDVEVIDWGPPAALRPKSGKLEKVYQQLKGKHPHFKVYQKDSIPLQYHYADNVRIQPITIVPDLHYFITRHRKPSFSITRGTHGYDPKYKDMHAIFWANGPDFKKGITVPSFENIHIYVLMCKLLGIEPSENDGDLDVVSEMLK